MREITVVTGPLRSGTSCITGLLERFGFDLGRNVRILRNPTEHNPRGHFEPDLLYTINERLLIEAGNEFHDLFGSIPDDQALAELASRRKQYFDLFIRKFDGELCKDPLLSLTLPYWENHWPQLQNAVFCLRHPMAVALSMKKRYGLPVERGMQVWSTFAGRFFAAPKRCRVYVFDFDAFINDPADRLSDVLEWLGRPAGREDIRRGIEDFFDPAHVHSSPAPCEMAGIPAAVGELYLKMRSASAP